MFKRIDIVSTHFTVQLRIHLNKIFDHLLGWILLYNNKNNIVNNDLGKMKQL